MKLPKIKFELLYNEKGKKSGVVLSPKNYEKLIDTLEDLHDLKIIYQHNYKNEKTFSFEEVKAELAAQHARK